MDLKRRVRKPTGIQSVWQYLDARKLLEQQLSAGLGPTPWTEELSTLLDIGFTREINCSSYDHCLDVAARMDWPSMTCAGCANKNLLVISEPEHKDLRSTT